MFQVKNFSSILASMINFVSSNTQKITDFNKGSVVRTLLESVAMELEEFYYQLQIAVEEAIDEAIYRTFNFPRNPPISATTQEVFTRTTGSVVNVTIPQGTLIGTETSPPVSFQVEADTTLPAIIGTATGGSTIELIDSSHNFILDGIIPGSTIYNTGLGGQSVVISITTTGGFSNNTLSFAALSGGTAFAVGVAYQVVVPYVAVPVIAVIAGTAGNVAANSITVLQSNVPNIQSVTNPAAVSNGADEETDTSRKSRFALYIQSLARATKGALQYAAMTVPQIVAAIAIDDVRPTVYNYQALTGTWIDITQSMRNPGDAAVNLFPSTPAVGDCLYIGANEVFNYINMHIYNTPVQSGTPSIPVWEYPSAVNSSGVITGWTTLPVTDGTIKAPAIISMTQSGNVAWTPPVNTIGYSTWLSGYLTSSQNSVAYGVNRLWVRLRITYGGATYSTAPTGDWCSLPPGLGTVNLYCHDGSGELSSTLQTEVENVVELYRGCGITVNVDAPTPINPVVSAIVTVAANYDPEATGQGVAQAIINYISKKTLGQNLFVAELYQLIMDYNTQAIVNVDISAPISDVIVPSTGVLRANIGALSWNSTLNTWVTTSAGVGIYSATTAYSVGQYVKYGASTYICIKAGTGQEPDTSSTYWAVVTTTNAWMGTYSSATLYSVGQCVQFGASTYICIQSGTNKEPDTQTAYWAIYPLIAITSITQS